MNPNVDDYIGRIKQWQKEAALLRTILLDCGLTEEYKWRVPCYTFNGSNIVLFGNFKEFCTLSFFKGVLLNDAKGILVSPGENSQSVKMARFTSLQDIVDLEATLKAYIYEAIEVEKAGIKIDKPKSKNLEFPEELLQKFEEDKAFKIAFEALTPGRQRAYNLHFTGAKQSATRLSRIEKYTDRIMNGIGINDCVCGHTKRKPTCDGSHKYL
ncbi:DUF1801 domain-containing protein [Arcticibacterium luteifluviistationis]|uniref:YdhG-like domain-containing protein n=1 Tax=Arcticibacterium luteifluviistationis TaxID=1784714 RepID=A0A2Z4GCT9_9BACT|nr:YdeI/OmpD-associated family protein [Arcticibacterium luteifluviistationis]AWV98845.1 hypothetical protein DJ013_11955 [Arcticibacterium luteifluviistationis]